MIRIFDLPIIEKPDDARHILGDDVYDELASKPEMPEGGKGHEYCEQYRSLSPADPRAKTIAEEIRAYYDAVRKAAHAPAGGG